MKVILENKEAEIVEKKSRFISNIFYIENENKANAYLQSVRKKYYDAKHWCYAYILGASSNIVKSSDDGEPQGTAGHPMLSILSGMELTNVLGVVTRYFGGTLLGTGGLVRAYSEVLKKSLINIKLTEVLSGYKVEFVLNYNDYGSLETIINKSYRTNNSVFEVNKVFENDVKLEYLIIKDIFDNFKLDIKNLTKGSIEIEKNDLLYYYIVFENGKYIWKNL